MSSNTKSLISKITEKTLNIIETDIKINRGDITQLVVYVMEMVEKSSITGEEKLRVTIKVLNRSIDKQKNLSIEEKNNIKKLIPSTIEAIINVSKGKHNFNKKPKKSKSKISSVKITEDLYNRLKNIIKEKKYNAPTLAKNLYIILPQIMIMVNEYPTLTGTDKKEIVLAVFDKLIDDIDNIFPNVTEENKILIKTSIRYLSPMIEQIINVVKDRVDINKIGNSIIDRLGKCCKKN